MNSRLAWVTARSVRGHDPDEAPVVAALTRRGVSVDVVDWDDPAVAWSRYGRVVLRSPWDYPERFGEFVAWLADVDAVTDLRNPLPMVRWNLDKRYLAELDQAGIPIIATEFVEPGEPLPLPGGAFVVKPSIGAGSRDVRTHHRTRPEAARAHVASLHGRGLTALVQPMLTSIARDGEHPMVFLGGRFSHAVVRTISQGPDGRGRRESSRPHHADVEELTIARAAHDLVAERFGVPTYARVDLVRDDAGRPCVLEVEVVEPSLFIPDGGPEAAHRLAAALLA